MTGAGVALDAASRGLSVVLLERTDLAAGTSRWSSKLVHGGLRYLAHGEIGLARESARERAVLMGSTAPHLVRRLPFLVPDEAGRDVTALAAAGGRLGDAVRMSVPGGRGSLPSTRRVAADEVSRLVPAVRPGRGGVVFWDAQLVDDARLVVALARTAAAFGARVLTGATVAAVDGADVHVSLAEGEAFSLRAGVVVNAAGVWAQRLAPSIRLVPSRGSHLVVPGSVLGSPSAALTVPLPGSRSRYVFALPQADGLVHLGLTDEPVEGPVPDEDPVPSDAEVASLLEAVNQVLDRPLSRPDVVGSYAGLRPLVLPVSAGRPGPGERDRGPLPEAPAAVGRNGSLRGRGQAHDLPGDGRADGGRGRRPAGQRSRALGNRPAAARRGGSAAGPGPADRARAPGRPVRHRGTGGGGAGPGRGRGGTARDGGGAAVRRPVRGCTDRLRPARPPHPVRPGAR